MDTNYIPEYFDYINYKLNYMATEGVSNGNPLYTNNMHDLVFYNDHRVNYRISNNCVIMKIPNNEKDDANTLERKLGLQ